MLFLMDWPDEPCDGVAQLGIGAFDVEGIDDHPLPGNRPTQSMDLPGPGVPRLGRCDASGRLGPASRSAGQSDRACLGGFRNGGIWMLFGAAVVLAKAPVPLRWLYGFTLPSISFSRSYVSGKMTSSR